MPLFRFHTGGLSESLATTIIVKNEKQICDAIRNKLNGFLKNPDCIITVKIEPYLGKNNFDHRTGWYMQIVIVGFEDNKNFPIGFLSEPL